MKLFISADLEGISGVVDPTFLTPGLHNYERARRLMTDDVNAVVEAAVESGVEEIVVADAHDNMNNILIEQLHPRARLITGSPRSCSMMEGLDPSFDAAFFVGYHARHGVPGVLSHTMSSVVKNLWLNGRVAGEFGFNAAYAGWLGVPVVFVSGDDCTAAEAKEWVPDICAAVVKTSVSRTAAVCLPLAESRAKLKKQARLALDRAGQIPPVRLDTPVELTIEFFHTGQAEMAALVPGSTYRGGTTSVTYPAARPDELYRVMRAMIKLAASAAFC